MGSCDAVCWPRGGELGDAETVHSSMSRTSRNARRCDSSSLSAWTSTIARCTGRSNSFCRRTSSRPISRHYLRPNRDGERDASRAIACTSEDIFTPALQVYFRTLIAETLRDQGITDLLTIVEDENAVHTPARVNADYPAGRSIPAIPPCLYRGVPNLAAGSAIWLQSVET